MPPQGSGNAGKTIAIIVGALVVVGAVIGGYFLFGGGGGGGGTVADDGKKYKLTAPQTVAGEYQKARSSSSGLNSSDIQQFEDHGVKNPKDVSGSYTSGAGTTAKQLSLSGVWGEVEDPEAVLDASFEQLANEAKKDSQTSGGGKAELEGERGVGRALRSGRRRHEVPEHQVHPGCRRLDQELRLTAVHVGR